MNRKANNIEIGSGHVFNTYHPNPFLYSVGTGFVKGLITIDIEIDFFPAKGSEFDPR